MNLLDLYQSKLVRGTEAAERIRSHSRIYLGGGAAIPQTLERAMVARANELRGVEVVSVLTFAGTMHIILAGLSSVTTMLTILLMGFWFRTSTSLRRFGTYSFLSVLAVFVSGGFAAASIATSSPLGRLIERITIGGFMQWLFVVGLKLYSEGTRVEVKQLPKAFPMH